MRKITLIFNLLSFVGTVIVASYQHWSARDLLWGLWISSLIVGYSYVVISIVGGLARGNLAYFFDKEMLSAADAPIPGLPQIMIIVQNFFCIGIVYLFSRWSLPTQVMVIATIPSLVLCISEILRAKRGKGFFPETNNALVRVIVLFPQALFLLGFMTIHFVGFHFIHSVFLNQMFPLIYESYFGKTMDGALLLFKSLFITALCSYGFLILTSALSRIQLYADALRKADRNSLLYPYLNVARMHTTIFIVAILGILHLPNFILYGVLVVYFFPFGNVLGSRVNSVRKVKRKI